SAFVTQLAERLVRLEPCGVVRVEAVAGPRVRDELEAGRLELADGHDGSSPVPVMAGSSLHACQSGTRYTRCRSGSTAVTIASEQMPSSTSTASTRSACRRVAGSVPR